MEFVYTSAYAYDGSEAALRKPYGLLRMHAQDEYAEDGCDDKRWYCNHEIIFKAIQHR
jgi:hypothetical protein